MTTNPSTPTCPKCSTPIPQGAPQGLCPKCVLLGVATATQPMMPSAKGPASPTVAEIGAHFPELEVLELIGVGGMGAVYKARQPKLDRFVALKILSRALAGNPDFSERFDREARVLARLSHPNIVSVFDCGMAGPFAYLMMEFVDGVNLRQAMQAGRFAASEALTLVQDVCGALKFAHEKGILHRDIKPENILIDAIGTVKIADFGIAKLVGENERENVTLTQQGAMLGSPRYMAPEQFDSPADVDQRADIYSLGVVLYELLTGELPMGRFAPPSQKSAVDARIDEIVMRTLERERELRFQTVGEVKTRMENVTQSEGGGMAGAAGPHLETAGVQPARETARRATAAAILTGISFLLGLLFFVLWTFKSTQSVPGGANSGGGFGALLAVALFLAAGLSVLFGIILGAGALSEIRQSGGRKGGFGRAMFGTLTWPVLLIFMLPAVLAIFILKLLLSGVSQMRPETAMAVIAAVTLGVGGIAAILLVRAVWRWAKAVPPEVKSSPWLKWTVSTLGLACMIVCLVAIKSSGLGSAGKSRSDATLNGVVSSLEAKLGRDGMSQKHLGRLRAALALQDKSDRDSSLAMCALDAARAGSGEVADVAASIIADDSRRESTRFKCAMLLGQAGRTAEATAIAEKMSDDRLRREALLKISRNRFETESEGESNLQSQQITEQLIGVFERGRPGISITADVSAGMAVTFDFIRVDATGKETALGLKGCIIAPDHEAFTANVRSASAKVEMKNPGFAWHIRMVCEHPGGEGLSKQADFEGNWQFEKNGVQPVKLTVKGKQRIKVGFRLPDDEPAGEKLESVYLEIETAPRPSLPSPGPQPLATDVLEKGVIGFDTPAELLRKAKANSKHE